ncbi:MAG: hypothetical protein RMJ55_18255, partial [Roseiflexaceae bacterium]|nr:hypothetical protein [Roseiflexaceae bacterium]
MIYHYVTDHEYRPPAVFIDAVMRCPLPYEEEYQAFMRVLGRETDDLTRDWDTRSTERSGHRADEHSGMPPAA